LSWNSTPGVAGKINPIFGSAEVNDLHPVLLIASVIVDEHALGIVGMIIAVPTITILQRIAKLLLGVAAALSKR
jgi:predicted PurR-regulated permease PerM